MSTVKELGLEPGEQVLMPTNIEHHEHPNSSVVVYLGPVIDAEGHPKGTNFFDRLLL